MVLGGFQALAAREAPDAGAVKVWSHSGIWRFIVAFL
jgi:hypothetical protein